jgi:hypothetical protein
MRTHSFTRQRETIEAQHEARRYNPAWEIVFRPTGQKEKVTFTIGAGSRDSLELFRSKGNAGFPHTDLYLLVSTNRGLDYVGLEVYAWCDRENQWEAREDLGGFLQNDEQIEDILGPLGLDLQTHNIARRMIQRVC